MVLAVDVLGLMLITTIIPAIVMVYVAWRNRGTPGTRWFAVTVCGIAGWSSAYGVSLIVNDAAPTLWAVNVRFFFTDIVTIAWFLLALEYIRRTRLPDRSPLVLLFVFPFVNEAITWLFPDLVHPSWYVDSIGVFHSEFGPWFYAQTVFSYTLFLAGFALLVTDFRNSQGIRRSQTGILVTGGLVPFIANVLFVAGITPYPDLDLTPVAFLITTAIFGWGLFQYRLLELLPIARKTVLDQMDDAVITLDENGRVVDINAAAADLFDADEQDAVGIDGTEFFSEYPTLVDRFATSVDVETEIEFTRNGENRYFHLEISPVSSQSDVIDGRVVVLRDVTALKEREQELDLLKQVLSRVLRHNIRNDVSVISGYAEAIATQTSGETATLARKIRSKSNELATRSHKAATVERVLSGTREGVSLDVVTAIDDAVERVPDDVGEFDVTTDAPDACFVQALPTLPIALMNVIENAVAHSDSTASTVDVSVDCGTDQVTVEIRDDGPGIPEGELRVFEEGMETQLEHSSGVGLWLVILIVNRSGGDVSFQNSDEGAIVRVTLERA